MHQPGYMCPFCVDRHHDYAIPNNLLEHVRGHHVDTELDDPLLEKIQAVRKVVRDIVCPHDRLWKCFHPDCAATEKVWLRLDAFNVHVIQVHGEQYVQETINQAENW